MIETDRANTAQTGQPGAARLVGRDSELGLLRSAVARAAGGAPGMVVLTGSAGVGKTRLAREAMALAGAAGFAVFAGRAHELDRDVAYAPFVEAFGRSLREMSVARRTLLVGDLPQLGLLFSGLDLTPPDPLGDAALERTRLVDGFARLIERLARESPLALVVDDLHTADPATMRLLRFLTTSMTDRPTLLIVTSRPDEPDVDAVAAFADRSEESGWWVQRITVQPMPPTDAIALLGTLLGRAVDATLAELVVARCAGLPLFIEAVTRTLVESGRLTQRGGAVCLVGGDVPLPEGVRTQLRARFAPAMPDEQTLLRLLAVSGGPLQHDALLQAAALQRQRALDALDRLYRRALVVASGTASGHDLAHGLLRDALLADMSAVAIGRAHADLADALAVTHRDDARVPEHVLAAGSLADQELALERLIRGTAHARRLGAGEDAARYLAAAIEIARDRGRTVQLARLLGELGELCQRLGAADRARSAWREAVAECSRCGDALGAARGERELATLAWSAGDVTAARERFAAAERALDGLAPSPEHAELLHARTMIAVRVGDLATVDANASALRRLADELGSPALVARACLAEGARSFAATDYLVGMERAGAALDAALASGDQVLVQRAYDHLSIGAVAQGDHRALRRHSESSLQVARQLGAPSLEPWSRVRLAIADLLAGEWDAALRALAEVVTLASRFGEARGRISVLGTYGWVLVHRGRNDEARQVLAEARQLAEPMRESQHNQFAFVAAAAGSLALAEGDPAGACAAAEQLGDMRGSWMPLLSAAVLGEARAKAGDIAGAVRIAGQFRAVRSCSTALPAALGDWIEGLAGAAGEARSGDQLLAAVAAFEDLGLPFYAARARLGAASVLVASDKQAAVEQARAALEVFDRLGAVVQARDARELLRSLGVVPSRGRARYATGTSMSRRELEVARLVAAGLSNADVATRLFVSPRTVTTHLDRIYGRLGLSSRTALTRYLADAGLLDGQSPSTVANT
ncbi:MAG: AAA family ATPase [Streptosporangiales bacterium]